MFSVAAWAGAAARAASAAASMSGRRRIERGIVAARAASGRRRVREAGEPPERLDALAAIDLRAVQRAAEDLDRAIVGGAVDRERRPVLAAVCERVAGRIA